MTSSAGSEAPPPLRVALLGPIEVEGQAGVLIEPASVLAKRFIALLALAAGRTVSTATIVDELWNERPPASARAALQTLVSRLRGVCAEGLIETSPSGYRLACRTEQVDLLRVEWMIAPGASGERAQPTLPELRAALGLWRGEAGADVADGELGRDLASRAAAARHALNRLYADRLAAAGEFEQSIGVLRGLRTEHPFDDSIVLRLLDTLVAAGRPGDALTEFEAHRRTLRDQLGATPSADVMAAYAALLRAGTDDAEPGRAAGARGAAGLGAAESGAAGFGAAGFGAAGLGATGFGATGFGVAGFAGAGGAAEMLDARFPDRATAATRPPLRLGVKAQPNALIGRDDDLAALNAMLGEARLVTILGAGGLGKTRLAQALAGDDARGQTAVVFVELASVRSPDDLLVAIGSASGVREAQTATRLSGLVNRDDLETRIIARLSEQATLLVLDNCEHIVESVAVWAAQALERVSTLGIVATSRSPLQIAAERVYALGPLSSGAESGRRDSRDDGVDGAGRNDLDRAAGSAPTAASTAVGPAVQLFFERARAARPSVVLHRETVERLCDRLDGMPLAIELAAARVRSMTVDEIERRLTNRFALLTGGDRTAPERHQTLLAVIDWSWNLLNDVERQLLRGLSLFPDGFSESAAEAVTGIDPVTDVLDALVNQSLVAVTESEATGTMRYRMLETVREFGQMALVDAGEDEAVTLGMARWASEFSREMTPRLDGATQISAFRTISEEHDNLVDILRRALDRRDGENATFVFSVLCAYWTIRGAHWEVVGFGRPFLDATRGYNPEMVAAATTGVSTAGAATTVSTATGLATAEADDRRILDAVEALVRCLAMVGAVGMFGDLRTGATARARLKKLKRIGEVRNERMRMAARFVLGVGSEEALADLMVEARSVSDPMTSSYAWLTSTQYAENSGDIGAALEYGARGFEQAMLADDLWTQSMMASMLAQLHSQSGHPREALGWAKRARAGLAVLKADDDLQQLEWLIAMNRIMIGETREAGESIRLLTERTVSPEGSVSPDMFSRDTVSIGWSGLAEIDRMNGDVAAALANFHRALDFFASPRERSSPWFLMLGSVYLSALTFDGVDDPAELEYARRFAARLRSRILATHRVRPQFLDLPVLGCALVGLSARLLPGNADEGLPMLALAERLGSRQDSPAIDREAHFARASALCGPQAVADARARMAELSQGESATLAFSLLKESRALRL